MTERVSIVSCVNSFDCYISNVKESTKRYADEIDYVVVETPPSAAVGLNSGLKRAKRDIVVCCHQDIFFLTDNWIDQMFSQLENVLVWGVVGCAGTAEGNPSIGCHSGLTMGTTPVKVQTVDGSLIVLNKENGLLFDERLRYFHMYDVDISLQANEKGLGTYVICAPLIHNTHWSAGAGLHESVQYLKHKWQGKVNTFYTTIGVY